MPLVLLVDHHELQRERLARRLARHGFDVHVSSEGGAALEAIARLRPDLVLMDVSPPARAGIDGTRHLRAHAATAYLPIIGLTTTARCADRDDALSAGCNDVDTRPVDLPRLLKKIARCLDAVPAVAPGPDSLMSSELPERRARPVDPPHERPDAGLLLVADADAHTRDSLSCRFERTGFRVVQAATGAEALAVLEIEPVDLVLLDVAMPGISGFEVLRRIRAVHSATALPVVMATDRDRRDEMVGALEAGANDYVVRPIDFAVALARVRTHLKAKRAERALQASEERYALVALGSNDGLFDWDFETDRVFYSERWASLLGLDHARLVPRFSEWISRVHVDEQARVTQELRAHIDGLIPSWESEHRIRHADGHYRWVLARGMTKRDASGRPTRLAGSLSDVTHAKVADPLTGLPNRLLFLERMRHALAAPRHNDAPRFAVIFMDLDGFKMVNDSLGHVSGDDLLVQVGRRLDAGVRRTDFAGHLSLRRTLSRLGGDEFAILLEDIHEEATAAAVAERLQAALQEPFLLAGCPVHCTLSIGVVLDDPRYTCGEELMRDADAAMYRAKRRGRGQSEIFTGAVLAEAQLRLKLEADLRVALESDQITPYYQPIVTLDGGALDGLEALVRWRHPERGLLGPDTFLPVAEAAGLISQLTYAVFTSAAAHLRDWRETWARAEHLTMSVNIAPRLLKDSALVDRLLAIVAQHALTPSDFKLEIVETTLLDASPPVVARLHALRRAGFALVLDDFGTGYSSLSYLHAFPLNTLKIDRTFINRMGDVSDDAVQMVRGVITLAHTLGMDVTAEGIETQAQVRWLQSLRCTRGQGFYFERAIAPESIGQLLENPLFIVPDMLQVDVAATL